MVKATGPPLTINQRWEAGKQDLAETAQQAYCTRTKTQDRKTEPAVAA